MMEGFLTNGRRRCRATIVPLDALWEIFGEDHLFYGSDWPVCEHAGDFIGNGLRVVRPYFAEKGIKAYNKFFWKNSIKAYNWKPRLASQR